jgi:hypothetical protein
LGFVALIARAEALRYSQTLASLSPKHEKPADAGGLFLSISSLAVLVGMLCQIGLEFFSLDC